MVSEKFNEDSRYRLKTIRLCRIFSWFYLNTCFLKLFLVPAKWIRKIFCMKLLVFYYWNDCRYDWHPFNHISFHSNLQLHKDKLLQPDKEKWESVQIFETVQFDGRPPLLQTMWPVHCIQGSHGAKLHEDLKLSKGAIEVYKGGNADIDSYSAFWDNGEVSSTGLLDTLLERNVTDIFVCGLATDICVNFTATHACKHNFRVILGMNSSFMQAFIESY